MNISNKINVRLLLVILFCFTFTIAYYTPMQSDDYRYLSIGTDFDAHLHHYLTWSGRVVADYVSTLLLALNNHTLAAGVNSLCLLFLIYLISVIPKLVSKNGGEKVDALSLLLLFLLYWTVNPNLGQTTFWIVGSANYLWTNMFIMLFLFLLLKFRDTQSGLVKSCLFLSALVAGCGNENTSPTLLLLFIAISVLLYQKEGYDYKNSILYTIGIAMGNAVLILAPGNVIRKNHPAFSDWNHMPLLEKIFEHFIQKVPTALIKLWPIFIIMTVILYFSKCSADNDKDQNYKKAFAFLVFLAFLCSLFVMVATPTFPARSRNGIFCYLLLSLSFLLSLKYDKDLKIKLTFLVLSLITFLLSYFLIFKAYTATTLQQQLRYSSIRHDIDNNLEKIVIPDFYFSKLLTDKDRFDTYHSPSTIGKFFGTTSIFLNNKILFDYSAILTGYSNQIVIHSGNDIYPVNFYVKDSSFLNKATIVFKLNDSKLVDKSIIVEVYEGGERTKEKLFSDSIVLSGERYYGVEFDSLHVDDIEKIALIICGSKKENCTNSEVKF